MFKPVYDENRMYDESLGNIIKHIKETIIKDKDDDFLLMLIGATGSGKSMLGLHIMDDYMQDEANIDFVGLNRKDFALSLNKVRERKGLKMCIYDEANISKRDSLTKFNKKLIDLYMAIRGLNIFHIWCNPSIEMLDKFFIQERINGVIYCRTKDTTKARLYYYFNKKAILKILQKYGNLRIETIDKCRRKYATYVGWYKDYTGKLREPYIEKKNARMEEKVVDFFKEYGYADEESNDMVEGTEMQKIMGLSYCTLRNYVIELKEKGAITDEDVFNTPSGTLRYSKEMIPIFKKMNEEKLHRRFQGLIKKKQEMTQSVETN